MKRLEGPSKPWIRMLWQTAALSGCLVMPLVGFSDTIVLKNGQKLEGRIISNAGGVVVFQDSSRVVLRLREEQIESIEEGVSALNLEQSGDTAAKNKDYDKALEFYTAALEQSADKRRIEPKIAEMRRQINMRDLGEFAERIQQVRKTIESGDLDRAQQQIDALQALNSTDESLLKNLPQLQSSVCYKKALLLLDSVNYVEAEKQLRRSLEFEPENASACVQLARIAAQIARTREEAVHYYKQALTNAANRLSQEEVLETKYSLAKLYALLDKPEDSVAHFREVHSQSPAFHSDLEESYVSALEAVAKKNKILNPDKAVEAYREALEVRPYDARIRGNYASNLVKVGRYDEAIEQYQQMLATNASFPNVYQDLAEAYREKGDYEKAREQLRLEVDRNPGNYGALVDLGDILVRMGDFDQARAEYLKARQIDSLDPRATISLAMAERLLGNYNEARRYAQEILAIRPDDPRVVLEMGLINKDDKKFDDALTYLDRTRKLIEEGSEEDKIVYRKLLADSYIASGEVKLLTRGPATATEDFNKALQVYPNYSFAHFNIGAAYQKKYSSSKLIEDLQSAEQNMKKAREIEPENPEFAFGLGVLYHQVLASADPQNEAKYLAAARQNYNDYLAHGGAEVTKVEAWLEELK